MNGDPKKPKKPAAEPVFEPPKMHPLWEEILQILEHGGPALMSRAPQFLSGFENSIGKQFWDFVGFPGSTFGFRKKGRAQVRHDIAGLKEELERTFPAPTRSQKDINSYAAGAATGEALPTLIQLILGSRAITGGIPPAKTTHWEIPSETKNLPIPPLEDIPVPRLPAGATAEEHTKWLDDMAEYLGKTFDLLIEESAQLPFPKKVVTKNPLWFRLAQMIEDPINRGMALGTSTAYVQAKRKKVDTPTLIRQTIIGLLTGALGGAMKDDFIDRSPLP